MSNSTGTSTRECRDAMLSAIRASLGRGALGGEQAAELDRRLAEPRPNVVPARGRIGPAAMTNLFVAEAERVNATVERLKTVEAVPCAVAGYLRGANLPLTVRVGTDPVLSSVDWSAEPALQVQTGKAEDADTTSVATAFAGIAETGTLMLLSAPESPTTLHFLPPVHMVLLPVARIVGAYEDAWAKLRAMQTHGRMPRVVNWITGPSRTADIEQTLLLGAHGPRRLHILICDEPEG